MDVDTDDRHDLRGDIRRMLAERLASDTAHVDEMDRRDRLHDR